MNIHFHSCIWAVLAGFLLTACYRDIDLEEYRPEPTLVLNSILSPDTVVRVQVARTVFFTDHRETDTNVADAEVKMCVNGGFTETLRYDETSRMYLSDYHPVPGELISLEAESPLGHASGQGIIPEVVPIEGVRLTARTFDDPDQMYWTPGGVTYGKSYEVTYFITFTDPSAERNFYFIRVESGDGIAAETIDYSYDDVFLAQQESIDGITTDTGIYGNEGRTFTDDLFNGNSYTLKIVEKAPLYTNDSRPRKIILYSLSEDYYHYLTGIFNTDEESVNGSLTDLGLAEPSPHYTNITGGTGIVGGVQSRSVRVDLKSVLE